MAFRLLYLRDSTIDGLGFRPSIYYVTLHLTFTRIRPINAECVITTGP
jgi:hypothetical protein